MPPFEQAKGRSSGPEYALLEYLERLERHREGRIAVHVHLSRLQQQNRREHHVRIAGSTFENIVSQYEGQLFKLRNHDLVFVSRGASAKQIDEAVIKLRYLFSEDPLVQLAVEDNDESGFCTWYRLDRDYYEFLAVARRLHQLSDTRLPTDFTKEVTQMKDALDPKGLAKLEELLTGADVSNLVRNQPICSFGKDGIPTPIFHEVFVSITDLENTLMPRVNVQSNPWLFRYLTQILDRRMLANLARDSEIKDRTFSINLNVSTLLSPEFLKFDQNVSSNIRGRLVIELQKVDIFSDMGAYMFAREYVRERGYRICLDGMTHLTLPFIDREKLGLDLVKLAWSPEMGNSDKPSMIEGLRKLVQDFGAMRVILQYCDSERAVEVGRQLGITMFQGRFVDKVLYEVTRPATANVARRYQ
jgi:EAL domain-containing protein (putative c-di-GMP-specific phosphodiesterase class I)